MKEKYFKTKTLKRFTAFLLVLCLTLLSIPFTPSVSFADAADGVYPVNIDEDSFISFIKEEGSLICDAPEGVSLECEKDEDTVFFTLKSFRDDDISVEIDIGSYSSDVYVLSGNRKETPSNAESASDAGRGPLTVSEDIDTIFSFLLPSEFVFIYEDDEVYMEITVDNPDFIYSDLSLKAERADGYLQEPFFLSDTGETFVYKMTVLEGEEEISVPASLLIRANDALSGVYDYVDGSFVPAGASAYDLDKGGAVFKTETLDLLAVSVMPLAGVGDVLDGDYAYIEAAWTDGSGTGGYDITTGTAPWDDTEGAGDDTSAFDNVVRTFDTVNYNITLATHMREDSDMSGYRSGKVYFEFIIDRPLKEAQFEPEAMPWIYSKDGSYTITEEEINGVTSQIMRGYFILSTESEGSVAIGEGTSSVNLVIRPLAMCNEDTIAPIVTLWLDYNEVGVDYSEWGAETDYDKTVTYDGKTCELHDEKEYVSITAPDVVISAVTSMRVVLSANTAAQGQGEFDFYTGNTDAVNYGIGKEYGRLGAFGACVQIRPKPNSQTGDMRGVEMPKYDGDTKIEFDIELTSSITFDDSSTKVDTTEDYTPLLWSIEGNESSNTQSDGRDVKTATGQNSFSYFPRNTGGTYNKCYDGGTWTAVQEGNVLHITVTDYELSLDIDTIPYTTPAGNVNSTTYFDRTKCNNYWEIGTYCISSGELFILQPYYTDYENDEGYILDYDGENHSGGTFSMVMKDGGGISDMVITSNNKDGYVDTEMTSQSYTTSMVVGYMAGALTDKIFYTELGATGGGYPLTAGCEETTGDWAISGAEFSTMNLVQYSGAEGGNLAVAFDSLTKFAPEFVQIEKLRQTQAAGTLSYGGKIGGWEDDREMLEATSDDLIFYSSLDELEADGYTCVAVLCEYRYLTETSQRVVWIDAIAKGEPGTVYLLTQYARVWTVSDLAQALVDDADEPEWTNKNTATDYLIGLSETEIQSYIDKYIPMRIDNEQLTYATDYPASTFIDMGRDGNTTNTKTMLDYTKCYYDEDGFHPSSKEGSNYADCCLLIGWTSDVSSHTAQTGTNGSYVQYYDMDTGQYIVDYDVDGIINRSIGEGTSSSQEVYDTVYISVEIPAEMSYIAGSSYIGGEYTDNGVGKQGSVEDGVQLLPGVETECTYTYYNGNEECETVITVTLTIEENADGSSTLLYTLKDVPVTGGNDGSQYLDSIHFSTQIDPMMVSNNDSLSVIAVVWTESDVRDPSFYSSSETSIQINKQSATSLIKHVDKTRAEAGSPLFYTVQFAVTSSNEFEVLLIDTLPFNGDNGSTFEGSVQIESFAVSADEDVMDLSGFDVFYTTDKEEHATKSDKWEYGDFIKEDGSVNEEIYKKGWSLLSLTKTGDNAYKAVSFPQEDIYAVAVVGKTSGRSEEGVLTQEMTLSLPSAEAGSVIVNTATQKYAFNGEVYDLTSSASTDIISRSVKGTVWLDEDMDGGIDTGTYSSEQKIEGVTVSAEIYDADTDTWEKAKDAYGNTCEAVTDENGCYELGNLYAGTYRLSFSNSSKDAYYLANLKATVFESETLDPEKTSKLDEEDKMLYFYLPDSSSDVFIETPGYVLNFQNAGFTDTQDFTVQKAWRDAFGKDIAEDIEEDVTVTVTVKNLGSFDVVLSGENEWTQTAGLPYYDGSGGKLSLSEEDITVTEEVPEGFTMTYQVHPDADRIVVLNRKDMYFDDVDILKTDEEGNPLKGAGFIVRIDYESYPTYYATTSSTSAGGTSSGYIAISFGYSGRINGTDHYYEYVTSSSDMSYNRKVKIVVKNDPDADFYVSTAKNDFVGDYFYTMETEKGTESGFDDYYASANMVSLTAGVPAYFYKYSSGGEQFTKYAVFDIDKETGSYVLTDLVNSKEDATVITSGEDGYMRLEGLIPGTYTVTEMNAPESYYYDKADTTFKVEEDSHTEEVVIENKQYTFSAEINKTDEEGNPLEGVGFALSKDENETSGFTDNDGKLIFEGLTAGTFVLLETDTPEEYQNAEPIEFAVEWDSKRGAYVSASEEYAIENGVLKINVVNEKKRFDVSVFTYEEEDEERLPLSGAGYSLYSSSGTLIFDALSSDENGLISLADIPVGTYILFETQAPEGYLLPDTSVLVFTLSASGAVTVIPETNFADVTDNVINVKNEKIPSTPRLPDTGGTGTFPYVFSGTALMGVCLFLFKKRKRLER